MASAENSRSSIGSRLCGPRRQKPRRSWVGIGDDAAVLGCTAETSILVTTDLLLEDVHFRRSYGDPYSLGVKAAAVNLSDIAAMGGIPTAAFISLGLPKGTDVEYLDELYRGLNETFDRFGATIAGGDTNVTPDKIVINVVQMGTAVRGREILRSTAQPSDVVIVTGHLGAAAAGFALLEAAGRADAEAFSPDAVRAQLQPKPRILEAQAAAATGGVTAMMDLSDGLMGDLAKLCRASGVGAIVWAAEVPVAPAANSVAECLDADAMAWALRGGEDYELLITSAPVHAAAIRDALENFAA